MIGLDDIPLHPAGGPPQPQQEIYRPPRVDVLRLPLIGRILRHRRGRLVLQLPLLLLTAVILYDALTGSPLAPQNLATVSVWIHYRGLVMVALLFFGNLFCMACPFAIPRTIALRLSRHGRRWPRVLRNKWLAVGAFVGFLFLYEWLDIWSSPMLTAYIIIGYFLGAFVLEALFAESPFCKYVCPLGTFNFVSSTLSPTRIGVRSHDTCRTCVGKECINGSTQVLGCGTELFAPQVQSNLDCVFCLDCARACPYDNVILGSRMPGSELTRRAWPRRWDVSFLVMVFAFAAVSNAFGMIPPFYDLQSALASRLPFGGDAPGLLLTFAALNLILPAALGIGAAWLSLKLAATEEPLRVAFSRFAPAFVPLAFAIWLAHYGFHFATGALTLIPLTQAFFIDHGLPLLGAQPDWALGPLLGETWLLPMQLVIVLAGFAATLATANRIARRDFGRSAAAMRSLLPWVMIFLALTVAALVIFNQPMEMRGTFGPFGG